MTSLASERSWLLDPGRLKLVHQCRRLIHSEFGVKLHLTEEQLEQRLASYADQSRSAQLTRTWDTLKHQIPGYEATVASETSSKRMYRGQPIADDREGRASDVESSTASEAPKKKVIYRGQVIG